MPVAVVEGVDPLPAGAAVDEPPIPVDPHPSIDDELRWLLEQYDPVPF
jgi:hypothetical protein